jgi:hypothetical protein
MNIVEQLKELIEKNNIYHFYELLELDETVVELEREFYDEGRNVLYWRHIVKTQYGFSEVIIGYIGKDLDEEESPEYWEINEVFPNVVQRTTYVKEKS